MIARVCIVGCGASKAAAPREARDLYTGPLFRAARAHVERLGYPWWVLSAPSAPAPRQASLFGREARHG